MHRAVRLVPTSILILMLLLLGNSAAFGAQRAVASTAEPLCEQKIPLCVDPYYTQDYEGNYVGHDEPSLLFYSNVPGSGNSNLYRLVLPKEPPTLPTQDGTGGTFNFQLHPASWFGMAL